MKSIYLSLICLIAVILGCVSTSPPPLNQPSPFNDLQFDSSYTNGLSNEERIIVWKEDQGIHWLPTAFFLSLNRPYSEGIGLFNERFFERPERLGMYKNYLEPKSGLPMGLTVSNDDGFLPMSGVSCFSCHTKLISYKSKIIVLDGSPSLLAIDRLVKEMIFSLLYTLASPSQFDAFYERYKVASKIQQKDEKLSGTLIESKEYKEFCETANSSSDLEKKIMKVSAVVDSFSDSAAFELDNPRPEDLDSKTEVFLYAAQKLKFFLDQAKYSSAPNTEQIAESGLGRSNPFSVVRNQLAYNLSKKESDEWKFNGGGAAATPSIHLFMKSKWIFYSGNTNSLLERHIAQQTALLTYVNFSTFDSTVSIKKINKVNSNAAQIKVPVYPEYLFGKVDQEKAARGKASYKAICLSCHNDFGFLGDPKGGISYNYLDVGTDSAYTEGVSESFYGQDFFRDILNPYIKQVVKRAAFREGITDLSKYENNRVAVWLGPKGNTYKAAPLWGIWTSAPYLHNNSVLNIRQLLTKPEKRQTSFWVGSYEFDPVNLGFKDEQTWYGSLMRTDCGNSCIGNSSKGHDFGTYLNDDQKDEIIEFLKIYNDETQF